MKKRNICEFSDILSYARDNGYIWNEACELFDNLRPQYEIYKKTIYIDDFEKDYNKFNLNEKELNLMRKFMKDSNTEEITVVRG